MKKARILLVAVCLLGVARFGNSQARSNGQQAQARGGEVRWSFDAGADEELQQSLKNSGD